MMTAEAEVPTDAYVVFSAEIDPNTSELLIATMAELANRGSRRVTLAMSTPGGVVHKGLTIYNTLRGMPFELITHNVGNVDSIGGPVFLAGEQRYACPHATFMFHEVAALVGEGTMLGRRMLEERTDKALANEKRIGTIIKERTSLSACDVDALVESAQIKDAAYAVGAGIVHEIKDIEFTPGVPVISLVFEH